MAAPGKITFEAHAERLDKLLIDLSKASGETLRAGPDLAGEIVAVSVHDVSLNDLRTKLADATDGLWKSEVKTLYLVRLQARLNLHRQRAHEQRKDALIEGLQYAWPLSVKKLRPATADPSRQRDIFPAKYLDLLLLIGLDNLADIDRGAEVTYSTHPGPNERPLPSEANELLGRALADYDHPMLNPVALTKLNISCLDQAMRCEYIIRPEAFDANGHEGPEMLVNFWASHFKLQPAEADQNGTQNKLELSNETQDFAQAYNSFDSERKPARPSPADEAARDRVRKRLARPDLYDPLWYGSDVAIALAKRTGRQLVCDLPDRFADDTFWELHNRVSATGFAWSLNHMASVVTSTSGEWTVVEPRDPDFSSSHRIDRSLLAEIGRIICRGSGISLAEVISLHDSGFHVDVYTQYSDGQAEIMDPCAIWASFAVFPTTIPDDAKTLTIYDSFSPECLRSLLRGLKGTSTDLSDTQADKLISLISSRTTQHSISKRDIESFQITETSEPCYVTIQNNRYAFLASSGWFSSAIATTSELAEVLEGLKGKEGDLMLKVGKIKSYTVEVSGSNFSYESDPLVLYDFVPKSEPIPVSHLPEDQLKALEAERVKLRVKDGSSTNKTSPPT